MQHIHALAGWIIGCRIDLDQSPSHGIDPPVSVPDIGQARTVFGWSPIISLGDGLAETWD